MQLAPCKFLDQCSQQAYKSSICLHTNWHADHTTLSISTMRDLFFSAVFLSLVGLFAACEASPKPSPRVQSFKVDLSKRVPRMLDLIKNTRLPDKPEYPGVGGSFGLDLDVLKTLKNEWIQDYSWQKDQSYMNRYEFQHRRHLISNEAVASIISLPKSKVWISTLSMRSPSMRTQSRSSSFTAGRGRFSSSCPWLRT
jgi:hypothetical protein